MQTEQQTLPVSTSTPQPTTYDGGITVRIYPNDKGAPSGKLADAEINFTVGILAGLRLLGFAVWERRSGTGRNVTFPARTYSVNGERRNFSLLRPMADGTNPKAQDLIRDAVLSAYAEFEHAASQVN